MQKYDKDKLKKYEIKILDYFVELCEKNNITYYLAYGTLLGAVRHKGFIPWDDDIDVHIKPEEYYKLKKIAIREKNDNFFYQSLETEKYYNLIFDKIRMKNTKAVESKNEHDKINKGIYIDIFPLIPYPNKKKDQASMWKKMKLLKLLIEADLVDKTKYNNYGKLGKKLSNFFKLIPRKIRNLISENILKTILLYKDEYDNYICPIDEKTFDRKIFNEVAKVTFENKKYNSPKNYDKYLTSIYGNYMQLPPIDDRKEHSFIEVEFDVKGE